LSKDTTKISTFSKNKGFTAALQTKSVKQLPPNPNHLPTESLPEKQRKAVIPPSTFNLKKVLKESINNYNSSPDMSTVHKKITGLSAIAMKVEEIQKENDHMKA
jgi:hypothetical protein